MAIDLVTIHHNHNDHHQQQQQQNPGLRGHNHHQHHEQLNSFLKFVNFSPFQEDHHSSNAAQFNLNLLELIKSTKLNASNRASSNQPPSTTNKQVNKSRRFSLPDLRRFLLRSKSTTSSADHRHNQDDYENNDNDSKTIGIKNNHQQCLQRLDSIQEYDSEESNKSNIPKLNGDVDQPVDRCIASSKDHHPIVDDDDIFKSSSTETLKVDDQISNSKHHQHDGSNDGGDHQDASTSTPTSIKPNQTNSSLSIERPSSSTSSSSPSPDGDNEEILETLRQVLRRCTKVDMSKRASASEVHQMLNTKLLNKYHLDGCKSRSQDHHNDDDNCGQRIKPPIQIEDSKD